MLNYIKRKGANFVSVSLMRRYRILPFYNLVKWRGTNTLYWVVKVRLRLHITVFRQSMKCQSASTPTETSSRVPAWVVLWVNRLKTLGRDTHLDSTHARRELSVIIHCLHTVRCHQNRVLVRLVYDRKNVVVFAV